MLGYLVIREGSSWTDVFRLVPGHAVTIGRAPTNQIVIKDERCSRCHAEVFLAHQQWTLRDLESRNGTLVGARQVRGDYILQPGDIVRIGQSQLAFVQDLAKAFTDAEESSTLGKDGSVTAIASAVDEDSLVLPDVDATTITHRRGQTKYLEASAGQSVETPKVGRGAAQLCRLAFELAQAHDTAALAEQALTGLFHGTHVEAGGLLLLKQTSSAPKADDLSVVASRAVAPLAYQRISGFLASTVLREGEAVLARNVMGDSALGSRDSKGDFQATSVICAPIRRGAKTFGLLHLYSTDEDRALDPDDLEFTLAVADTLGVALENLGQRQELAANLSKIKDENVQLRERLGVESEIVGSSPLMSKVAREIARAAPNRATVLIRGESGVGKELVARAIHFSGPRSKGPFVCLNCAALSEGLLESELFGHEKGAFTGATERKIGKFEAAHEGTLMLDEIGEMSPAIQAKFLRVLEGHPFERVGGSASIRVEVRVIAATNRDLEQDVSEGRFRRDLYFRLHVLEIIVPSLRKRPEDILVLARYFLQRFNGETGRRIRGFSPSVTSQLLRYRWPGNVRELKNVIERAVVLARGELIEEEDLTLTNLATVGDSNIPEPPGQFQPLPLAEIERRHILAMLRSTGGNKSQAASLLGIERSTLDRKIRRYESGDPPTQQSM